MEESYSMKRTVFKVQNKVLIEETEEQNLINQPSVVVVGQDILENETWANHYFEQKRNRRRLKEIRYCKLELHEDAVLGTMRIPCKSDYERHVKIAFYVLENRLIFIDDTDYVRIALGNIFLGRLKGEVSLSMILEEFFLQVVESDQQFLASLEKKVESLEEKIIAQDYEDFHVEILNLKKEISRMNRYYHQISDMIDDLQSSSQEENPLVYRIFDSKISRLLQETIDLREYAMQVQDVYMSEIGIRQNNVMKMLTIVTTIFMPLTLLVGWYGMNFVHMPELSWKYGYFGIIGISILIIFGTLWFIKRKKWM